MFKSYFTVNRNKVLNDDYVGSCGVYHGFAFQQSNEALGLIGETREREFKRVRAMKLKVARTWYRPDYSRDMLERFMLWLDEMKKDNVDVALQSGWWFTKDIWYFAHENFDNPEFTKDVANFDKCCDKLAAWIAKSLEYFITVRGYTNIKYLVLFTEPTSYASGPVPDGMEYLDAYERCCRKIHNKLIEYGLRDKIKLMGPNGVFTSYDDTQLQKAVTRMDDIIDIYTLHTYSWSEQSWQKNPDFYMTDYNGWLRHAKFICDSAARTGKPVWADEYGLSGGNSVAEPFRDSGWYGNYIAMINAAFINGGIDGSFIWLLFDQKYFSNTDNNDSFHNGIHRWGTCYMPGDDLPDSTNARPSWYALSLISRYMSDGCAKVYDVSFGDGICGASTAPADGKTSVMVVNMCGEDAEIEIKAGVSGLRRYLYNPQSLQPSPDYIMIESDSVTDGDSFTAVLPPFSVAIWSNL